VPVVDCATAAIGAIAVAIAVRVRRAKRERGVAVGFMREQLRWSNRRQAGVEALGEDRRRLVEQP